MSGRETVIGWLSNPGWPEFGPGIGSGPLDPGRMAARAAAEQVLEQFAVPTKIGVLAVDTGDYDAYVAYFDDPVRLAAAVAKLNEERRDDNTGENASVEVHTEAVLTVPAVIDDTFLDLLAGLANDSAYTEIEYAEDRRVRLAEEAAEQAADEIPFIPSPGQEEIGL